MRKRLSSLFLCAALLWSLCLPIRAADPPEAPILASAPMALLYEETTDTLLFSKNAGGRNPAASMTKVMTALLVLEHDPALSGDMTVPAEALTEANCYWMLEGVHLQEGEEISVMDLMRYLLICSGNEAATTLAIYVSGDIPTFLDKMNAKAQALGMTHTQYHDPHGLSDNNLTTCEDMLLLCREAMKNDLFRELVSTTSGSLPVSNKREKPYRYTTTNRVMYPRNTSVYDGGFSDDIIGIKTGSTTAAGLNLACCMEYDGLRFYSVVMHAGEVRRNGGEYSGHHVDTLALMTWARQFKKTGYAAGEQVSAASTAGSLSKNLALTVAEDLYVLTGDIPHVQIDLEWVGLSVKAGEPVGTLTLTDAFGSSSAVELLAMEDASTGLISYGAAAAVLLAGAALAVGLRRRMRKDD